ncbi:MAG TPA: hypothetical protein ENI76_09520 [Ignavibacteria bacterium]|nr:hypothetical protein [Ignavibacteria bacterium]
MVRNSFSSVLSNFVQDGKSLKVIVQNNSLEEFQGELHVKYISLPKGKIENIKIKKLKIKPLYKNPVISLMLPENILNGKAVIISSLYNKGNELLHRNFYKNFEWKHIKMPKAKIEYNFKKHDHTLVVKADTPVFFLYFESPDLRFEDNGIIMLPGEKMSLKVQLLNKKFNKKTLTYHSLNQYLKG